jgi:hypothetical protein
MLQPFTHRVSMSWSSLSGSVKRLPLWLLLLLSLAGYVLIRLSFALIPFYNHSPQPDIRAFTPSLTAGLRYAALLCALFGLYSLAYRRARQRDVPLSLVSILLVAALFALPLLFTFPFNATDVYRYFIRGRITTVYHHSPFSAPPEAFSDDAYLSLAGEWMNETSPYGPVWEMVAAAVTRLNADNLLWGLLSFKALAVLAHLAIGSLIWLVLGDADPTERAGRTLLWAWNPALLLTFAVDGHNDGLMLFWLLLGWWLMRRGRPEMGQIVMALAPLTKPIGLLPLPFFFLATWRQMPRVRAKIRFLLVSGLGCLAVVWLTFLPFGSPLALAQRLFHEAAGGGGFSLTALLILASRRWNLGLPALRIVTAATALFGLLALWLLWRTWRGRSPIRGTADVLAAYLVEALKFRIWYTTWLFPWLLLDLDENNARRLRAGAWLLLTGQLSVVIYGHLRAYCLGKSHLLAHLLGVPFTFALPLLALLWPGEKRRRERPGPLRERSCPD